MTSRFRFHTSFTAALLCPPLFAASVDFTRDVKPIFDAHCAGCHGAGGMGAEGPALSDEYWIHGRTDADIAKAIALAGNDLGWQDLARGQFIATPEIFGDVVLARKDTPASYHLSVVMDDARQGVTLVTRGEDLLEATHLHRLLIELLKLPVPQWEHHRLIVDENGRRLAKRDDALSLRALREEGWTPERVRDSLGC